VHPNLSPIEPTPRRLCLRFLHDLEKLARFIRAEYLLGQRRAAARRNQPICPHARNAQLAAQSGNLSKLPEIALVGGK